MESKNIKMYTSSWILGILIVIWSYFYHRSLRGSYLRLAASTVQSLLMIYWMWGVLGGGHAIFFYKEVCIEAFYPILFIIFVSLSVAKIFISFLQFLSYREMYLKYVDVENKKDL